MKDIKHAHDGESSNSSCRTKQPWLISLMRIHNQRGRIDRSLTYKEVPLNYFAVHKQSNVILRVIHSAVTPNNTADLEFYPAAKGRVSQYQARLKNDAPIGIYSILPSQ